MKLNCSFLWLLALLFLFLSRPFVTADFEGFEDDDEFAKEELDSSVFSLEDLPLTKSESVSDRQEVSEPPPESVSEVEVEQSPPATSTTSLDYWDEDEFEGVPVNENSGVGQSETNSVDPLRVPLNATGSSHGDVPKKQTFVVEIACGTFLIIFAINFFTGKKENENIALSWAAKFAARGSLFEKNFSLLGVGEGEDSPLLLKEGQNAFKFYASGRRYCQGLLATMELKSRHDLISRLYNMVVPCQDEITIEVYMNDDAMDHVIFAIARKKLAKAMQKEERDLQKYSSILALPTSGRKWIADELAMISESKEVAMDLVTDLVLEQVFGEKAFEKFGKWFISMHFTDQNVGGHKKVLFFKFALPDAKHMGDMTRLIALIPYYIDLLGRYKLSSQARSKTELTRSKAAQEAFKELQGVRQEALQKKKAEKKRMLEESEAKLSAEALRKKESKERARQMRKAMPKIKMSRV